MKVRCEVLSVAATGDQLSIKAQGTARQGAAWRSMEVFDFRIADTKTNRRAFYVGRGVSITVTPEGGR